MQTGITTGSNRSLRSLGRAKARPLTKRYAFEGSPMLNSVAQGFSFAFLLVGPLIFGLLGKPTEMGLSILAGALSLAFSNIDKISKFKGAGFEAEMREKVGAIIAKEAEPEKNNLS